MIGDYERISMEIALQHLSQASMRCFELGQKYSSVYKAYKQIGKAIQHIKEEIYKNMDNKRK